MTPIISLLVFVVCLALYLFFWYKLTTWLLNKLINQIANSYYFRIGFCLVFGALFQAVGSLILKDFIEILKHRLFDLSDLLPLFFVLLFFFVSFAMFFVAWKLRKVKGRIDPDGPAILFRRWF